MKDKKKINELKELIEKGKFDYRGIQKFIPQREPFLMLDSVLNIDVKNKQIICQKCISVNEWYLAGHFPDIHIMPGVLLIESMAQAASIIGEALTIEKDGTILFLGIENCDFISTATAGDVLKIFAKITKIKGPMIIGECEIKKEDKTIACCKLKAFKKII